MKKIFSKVALVVSIGLALAFTFSCSSDDGGNNNDGDGSFGGSTNAGSCDIKDYKTVPIGSQTWMAENYNCYVPGSKCYGEGEVSADSAGKNCAKYGRLYDWATAMDIDVKYNDEIWDGSDVEHRGICPEGWHIPSKEEWNVLMKYVDPDFVPDKDIINVNVAGTKLKAIKGWGADGSKGGTDDFGFSAISAGLRPAGSENFQYLGYMSYWWTTTPIGNGLLQESCLFMGSTGSQSSTTHCHKNALISLRCIKNSTQKLP